LSRCDRDMLRHRDVFGRHPELLQELNLDVSIQELLSAERAFTYADVYAILGNQNAVVWLTPHAFIVLANERGDKCSFNLQDDYRLRFNVDGKYIHVLAHFSEAYSEIANIVFRLLAASVVHSVILDTWRFLDETFFNATSLAYLMEQCHSLKAFTLKKFALDEDNIRVLGEFSKPDLEIKLDQCQITGATATVLAQVLGRNQGPTKLDYCYIDNFALADGLRGNSRLKSLRPRLSINPEDGNQELLAIAGALEENTGLVHLDIRYRDRSNHYELWRGTITPYLEANRARPRVYAIQKARPIAYRTKILGRAHLAALTDVNRFWMLLSGNVEIAFPLTMTATTTPAATLPTLATAAATSNAAVIAVTAAVTVIATRTASTTAASATTKLATPTACCTFTAAVAVTATRTAASAAHNGATPTAVAHCSS
jgi:hypothetical protein